MPELADLLQLTRRSDLPAIRPGDTVRVHVRVVEGNRERPQMFEGVVLEVKKPNAYDGCFMRRTARDRLPPRRVVTAIILGDPPPGRSAQDKLNARLK